MDKKLKVFVSAADSRYLKNSKVWPKIKKYVTVETQNTIIGGISVRTEDIFSMKMDTPADFYEIVKLITKEDNTLRVSLNFTYYKDSVYMEIDAREEY